MYKHIINNNFIQYNINTDIYIYIFVYILYNYVLHHNKSLDSCYIRPMAHKKSRS